MDTGRTRRKFRKLAIYLLIAYAGIATGWILRNLTTTYCRDHYPELVSEWESNNVRSDQKKTHWC